MNASHSEYPLQRRFLIIPLFPQPVLTHWQSGTVMAGMEVVYWHNSMELITLKRIYLKNRNRLTDLENEFMVTRGKGGWGRGIDWEFGIDMYTLLYFKLITRASLVAQWLRICLSMQGTWLRALVQEDPTCHRATKPVRHNYWACTLEPASHNYWAHVLQLLKPACLEPVLRNKRGHHNKKPVHSNEE